MQLNDVGVPGWMVFLQALFPARNFAIFSTWLPTLSWGGEGSSPFHPVRKGGHGGLFYFYF